MRRSRTVLGLVALVVAVVVAGVLGSWLGGHSLASGPPPPVGAVPIAPGAPERLAPLLPARDGDDGLGGRDAVLTPDGGTLVTVDDDDRLAVADLGSGRVDQVASGTPPSTLANQGDHPQDRRALALAPDSRTVWVTDGWGRRVRAVDLSTRAIVADAAIPAVPTAVAVVGGTVVVGDATGAVTTLDASTRRPLAVRDVAAGPVADLAASPDGRRVVVAADPGGEDGPGAVALVDLADPRAPTVPYSWPVTRPRGLGGTSTVVSPDGARAYVVTGPRLGAAAPDAATVGGVAVLDLRAGREVTTLPGTDATAIALSPDGRRLYLARAPELQTASGPSAQLVLDAVDITALTSTPAGDIDPGPPGRPLGSLSVEVSSGAGSWLVAAPDGRRLYAVAGEPSVVTLRAG